MELQKKVRVSTSNIDGFSDPTQQLTAFETPDNYIISNRRCGWRRRVDDAMKACRRFHGGQVTEGRMTLSSRIRVRMSAPA
jgi:hypothetical protein